MAKIPLSLSDRRRDVLRTADVLTRNRYTETNPVLTEGGPAHVQRPALNYWITVGDGPIRAIYNSPGAFLDDVFVMSLNTLYRVDSSGTATVISTDFSGGEVGSAVSMAATGYIGSTPEYLFISDGETLRVYLSDGFARGILTSSAIANNDTVTIDGVVYKFTSGSVDAGTPAGTGANPWLVKQTGVVMTDQDALFDAINATGTAGTTYSTALTEHTTVAAYESTTTGLYVRAKTPGVFGNALATTETGAGMAWGGATLASGGTPSITQVVVPDDVGVISVGYVNGYVIVIPAQGQGINGRFYWIDPGETTIDPLNYATAERSTDPVHQVVVFGDQFWLPGQSTTEVWYITGDPAAPVLRMQGIVFDRGAHEGTALQVKDAMVIVDFDGAVFKIKGQEERISTPDIEERIRKAIAYQALRSPS